MRVKGKGGYRRGGEGDWLQKGWVWSATEMYMVGLLDAWVPVPDVRCAVLGHCTVVVLELTSYSRYSDRYSVNQLASGNLVASDNVLLWRLMDGQAEFSSVAGYILR